MDRKKTSSTDKDVAPSSTEDKAVRKNGGWQEIEAMREKAELKESLADVWDEDFDLDEEVLAELDHKAEFFTTQEDEEEEFDEDEEGGEFFEDDPI